MGGRIDVPLYPPWRVGSGDVSLQAYHLIHNLHVNLATIPIDRLACDLTAAGLSLIEWGLVGLTSSLLGLPVIRQPRSRNSCKGGLLGQMCSL